MKNIKAVIYVILIIIVVLGVKLNVYSHGLIYELLNIGDNKIRINLKWDQDEKKGIRISYYYLENAKTLHIGYETNKKLFEDTYLDFNTANAVVPIKVILENPEEVVFSDIKNSEYKEYILHLHSAGIVNGKEINKFYPDDKLTRTEFLVLLIKALKINLLKYQETNFYDISSHWGKDYIYTGIKNGFIRGYDDNTIKPDNYISIAEVCVIISRTFNFKSKKNGIYSKLQKNMWYSESVKYLFDSGVLKVDDIIYNKFTENKFIFRKEAALILSRAISTY